MGWNLTADHGSELSRPFALRTHCHTGTARLEPAALEGDQGLTTSNQLTGQGFPGNVGETCAVPTVFGVIVEVGV